MNDTELYTSIEVQTSNSVVPDAVTTLMFDKTLSQLTWDPANALCTPTAYLIEIKPLLVDMCMALFTDNITSVEVAQNSVKLSNLYPEGVLPFSTFVVNVTARNYLGDSDAMTIMVESNEVAPLGTPTNISATASNGSHILLSWNEVPCGSRGGIITEYAYEARNSFDIIVSSGRSSETSVGIGDLQECSVYTFSIAAINAKGTGPFVSLQASTVSATAPQPVRDLSYESLQGVLEWSATFDPDSCPPTSYYLQYQRMGSLEDCMPEEIDGEVVDLVVNTNNASLLQLSSFSSYIANVSARNDGGDSEPMSIVFETAEEGPSEIPLNLTYESTSTTSLTFSWGKVPCGHRNGVILGYIFLFYPVGGSERDRVRRETTNTTATFDELNPCVEYVFGVIALNSASRGPSTTISVNSEALVTNIAYNEASSTISWDVSSDTSCAPTGYLMEFRLSVQDMCMTLPDSKWQQLELPADTQFVILPRSLEPNNEYILRITPLTEEGMLPPTTTSIQSGESRPTGRPRAVTFAFNENSVTFSWSRLRCGDRRGLITAYEYMLLVGGREGEVVASGMTNDTHVTIDNFDICINNLFKVRAKNSAGSGPDANKPIVADVTSKVPNKIQTLTINNSENATRISWNFETTEAAPCEPKRFILNILLTNMGMCLPIAGVDDLITRMTMDSYLDLFTLQPFSSYNVVVIARNQYGDSVAESVSFDTPIAAPTSPPQNISIANRTTSSLTISWDEIPCQFIGGGVFYGYAFQLSSVRDNRTVTDMTNDTVFEVEELAECTRYNVSVAVVTSAGVGAYRDIIASTERNGPGDIEVITHNTSNSQLEWSVPATGCPVTHYLVESSLINLDMCSADFNDDGTQSGRRPRNRVSLESLVPNSLYVFNVTAINDRGSSRTTSITVETPISAPRAGPSNLTLVNRDANTLHYSWGSVPCGWTGGGILMHYAYNLTSEDGIIIRGETTEMNVVIDGLPGCEQFSFEVAGVTTAGVGPSSTLLTEPELQEPGDIQPIFFNKEDSRVFWSEPTTGCPVTEYLIEYTLLNLDMCSTDLDDTWQRVTTPAVFLQFPNLVPNSVYRVNVTAINVAGASDPASITVITRNQAPRAGPSNLTLVNRDANTLHYSWGSVPCGWTGGGILMHYAYNLTSEDGIIIRGETTEMNVVIDGLPACEQFSFEVAGVTTAGVGPSSTLLTELEQQEPGDIQTIFFNKEDSRVFWSVPTTGCPVTEYVIEYTLLNLDMCSTDLGDTWERVTTSVVFLQFPNLIPNSVYRVNVSAINNGGASDPVSLTVITRNEGPSGRPTGISVSSNSTDRLTFSWEEPPCGTRGDVIVGYDYVLSNDGSVLTSDMTTSRTLILDGLQPCTEYSFSISSRSRVGQGPAAEISVWTGAGGNDTVTDIAFISSNGTLMWNAPVIDCPVTGYRVSYKLINFDMCEQEDDNLWITQEEQEPNADLSHLAPNSVYAVTVVTSINGLTDMQDGVMLTIETGEIAPSTPPISVSFSSTPNSTTFSWDEVPCGYRGGVVKGYSYELQSDVCMVEYFTGNVTDEEVTIDGLRPGNEYMFRVLAWNNVGASNFTEYTMASTEPGAPSGPPVDVTITSMSTRSLTMEWNQPKCEHTNGNITLYTYKVLNQITGSAIFMNTSITSWTILDLIPYTEYIISVSAWNAAGQGPFSNGTRTTTDEEEPSAPVNVSSPFSGLDYITVEWYVPDPPNGIITSYLVEYWELRKPANNRMNQTVVRNSQMIQHSIYDLETDTSYGIRVRAETRIGYGPWSRTIIASTIGDVPGQPENLEAEDIKENSITLTWTSANSTNSKVLDYTLTYLAIWKPYVFKLIEPLTRNIQPAPNTTRHEYIVDDLEPSTGYEFSVSARTSGGSGKAISTVVFTDTATDIDVPGDVSIDFSKMTATTVPINFTPGRSKYISSYFVGVRKIIDISKRDSNTDIMSYKDNQDNYVAAEITRSDEPQTFIVGDNKTYVDFYNAPLTTDVMYAISVGSVTRTPNSLYVVWGSPLEATAGMASRSKLQSDAGFPIIPVILVIAVIITIVFVVLVIVFIRKRSKSGEHKPVFEAKNGEQDQDAYHPNPTFNVDDDIALHHENPVFTHDDVEISKDDTGMENPEVLEESNKPKPSDVLDDMSSIESISSWPSYNVDGSQEDLQLSEGNKGLSTNGDKIPLSTESPDAMKPLSVEADIHHHIVNEDEMTTVNGEANNEITGDIEHREQENPNKKRKDPEYLDKHREKDTEDQTSLVENLEDETGLDGNPKEDDRNDTDTNPSDEPQVKDVTEVTYIQDVAFSV
ncbi:protein sidekick-2-like [Amphiura filiformis]|uniref:protein sidekick-2-like n=1 Tax=Amphiura filiformis TaxID=82378 RepID=UPI003B22284D